MSADATLPPDDQGIPLSELCDHTQESARTVRFYILSGLLAGSSGTGPQARYPRSNIARVRLIRAMQAQGLSLAKVREALERRTDDEIEALVADPGSDAVTQPGPDAADPQTRARAYTEDLVQLLVHGVRSRSSSPHGIAEGAQPAPPPRDPRGAKTRSPQPRGQQTRSHWERIELHPDIELHVRRPLTPWLNRRLDDLLREARRLFQEVP